MAAHVASAAIRRLQQDNKHKVSIQQHGSCGKDDKVKNDVISNVPQDVEDSHSASGVSPPKEFPNANCPDGSRGLFEPAMSSTPKRKGTQHCSYNEEPPYVTNSSSSTTDSESINSPSSGSVSGFMPCSSSLSVSSPSGPPSFRAPILGYEILEQRAKFTVFKINVQHIPTRESWFVFRRYTDFLRLHRKLKGLFPMQQFSLPPKRWFKDNFEPSFLDGRIQGLQMFVNSILNHKDICESHHVRDFFCFDDPPGPNDCLAESRLRCETLEELVCSLRLELTEKQAEIDVVKAELALTKVQRDTLMKSLSMEHTVVSNPSTNLTSSAALLASPERQHSFGKRGKKQGIDRASVTNSDMYLTAVQTSASNTSNESLVNHNENHQNAGLSRESQGIRSSFNGSIAMCTSKKDQRAAFSGHRGDTSGVVQDIEHSSSSTDNNGNQTFCRSHGIRMHSFVQK